ncbi:hypothetical protein JOB18_038836 [Solea senegalensis]|uniref:Uncharacterized protein n=1 Tax=Solea senegalensis TaxID=28829 RepID=A0AAV6S107_SOLSE|nr:hypothetical protein JOB18_038836 [Solea senegalensis]
MAKSALRQRNGEFGVRYRNHGGTWSKGGDSKDQDIALKWQELSVDTLRSIRQPSVTRPCHSLRFAVLSRAGDCGAAVGSRVQERGLDCTVEEENQLVSRAVQPSSICRSPARPFGRPDKSIQPPVAPRDDVIQFDFIYSGGHTGSVAEDCVHNNVPMMRSNQKLQDGSGTHSEHPSTTEG